MLQEFHKQDQLREAYTFGIFFSEIEQNAITNETRIIHELSSETVNAFSEVEPWNEKACKLFVIYKAFD